PRRSLRRSIPRYSRPARPRIGPVEPPTDPHQEGARMTREPRPTTAAQPERTSRLDRLRLRYHALPLSRRLVAALVVCFVACVLALVIGLSVLGVLTTVAMILV